MKRIFLFILLSFLFSRSMVLAQERKALLIGINAYFKKQNNMVVPDAQNSLKGCVNDARSIRELITGRFGFKPSNVKELYDKEAKRANIIQEIEVLLASSNPGDVAFVYYSGHGMTYRYGEDMAQTAEAICPSDIFLQVPYAYIQTSELISLFNKFVDKKVILTVILDCCHSNGTIGIKIPQNFVTRNGLLMRYTSAIEGTITISPPLTDDETIQPDSSKNNDTVQLSPEERLFVDSLLADEAIRPSFLDMEALSSKKYVTIRGQSKIAEFQGINQYVQDIIDVYKTKVEAEMLPLLVTLKWLPDDSIQKTIFGRVSADIKKEFYTRSDVDLLVELTNEVNKILNQQIFYTEVQPDIPIGDLKAMSQKITYRDFLAAENKDRTKEFSYDKSIFQNWNWNNPNASLPKGYTFKEFPYDPPSQRENSKFLLMTATNDVQKAKEIKDENGDHQGVFTKAIIHVFKEFPAATPSELIFNQIRLQFTKRFVTQTPTLRIENSRRRQNLFGVKKDGISDEILISCVGSSQTAILLNKGKSAGLAKGNILKDKDNPKVYIKITALKGNDTAMAQVIKGNNSLVEPGHQFRVVSYYTESKPLIKVYIPNDNLPFSQLSGISEKYIKPLLSDILFMPVNKKSTDCAKVFMKKDSFSFSYKTMEKLQPLQYLQSSVIRKLSAGKAYFVYLPMPTEITDFVRNKCLKDQNIELVDDPLIADISFYCMYSSATKDLVFVCDKETTGKYRKGPTGNTHNLPAYFYTPTEKDWLASENSSNKIGAKIYDWLLLYASQKGWLNYDARK